MKSDKEGREMKKKWFKVSVYEEDGDLREEVFVKASSAEEAVSEYREDLLRKDLWADDYRYEASSYLTREQEERIAHEELVQIFMRDCCTRKEAEAHIKKGSVAIPTAEWDEWAADNDYTDENGEIITLEEMRTSKDISVVKIEDGTEYILIYVL